jgi:hypothetical protein
MMAVHNSLVLNPLVRKPSKPSYFNTSEHLLRIGRQKASTLAELLQALRTCPDDSIFQHTFSALVRARNQRDPASLDHCHSEVAEGRIRTDSHRGVVEREAHRRRHPQPDHPQADRCAGAFLGRVAPFRSATCSPFRNSLKESD